MDNLSGLKNRYSGRRIFVIGNGPSLNRTPLNMLTDEYTIAMNRISLLYDKTNWRPTFFVCTTTNIRYPEWHRDIMRTINSGVVTFAGDKLKEYIGDHKNVHYLNCTHGEQIIDSPLLEWWSDDISKRVCKYATSMLVAFQVAFYLGFKELYIVGADLAFSESLLKTFLCHLRLGRLTHFWGDKNHFSSKYGTPGCTSKVLNRNMLAAHNLVKGVAQKHGVKIFNATLGGRLEVYPRVNFFDLFDPSSARASDVNVY